MRERSWRAFSASCLEVHPELGIGPILIGAGAQVLLDIGAGEEVPIASLEGYLAIHEKMRPNDIQFVADVPRGVVRLRIDIDSLSGAIPVVLRIGQVQTGGPDFDVIVLGWAKLQVNRGFHHVLPAYRIHVAHVDMVGPPQILKGVGSLTPCVTTDRTVRPAITRGIVEVEGQPRLPFPLVMCVADPASSRPGIDVEILLVSIACAKGPTGGAHFAELVDRLVPSIKVAFTHLDPASDHVASLIRMFRCTET